MIFGLGSYTVLIGEIGVTFRVKTMGYGTGKKIRLPELGLGLGRVTLTVAVFLAL